MQRFTIVIAADRLTDQYPKVPSLRQLKDTLDATRRSTIFAEEFKEPWIGFGNEDLGTDIGTLATLLNLDGLGEDLVLFAGIQEQSCTLQRRVREGWHAQIVVLAFDDLPDGG